MPQGCPREASEEEQRKHPGRFTYSKGGGQRVAGHGGGRRGLPAGVRPVRRLADCQEHRGHRTGRARDVARRESRRSSLRIPAYTAYYVAQALYQVGGDPWKRCYPLFRDRLISSQIRDDNAEIDGGWRASGQVDGKPGMLYQTAVACFVLAIPNRYLPILQEGKIKIALRKQFRGKKVQSVATDYLCHSFIPGLQLPARRRPRCR